jgi:hypothetical protein
MTDGHRPTNHHEKCVFIYSSLICATPRYYGATATRNLTDLRHLSSEKERQTAHQSPYARPASLERLHAELGGKILENKQEHEDLAGQMRHVEAMIKMLDPATACRRFQ